MANGGKVGIYCSDVSGAFDRVDSAILIRKLSSAGCNSRILSVLENWLDVRRAQVVVSGEFSEIVRM